MPKVAEYSVILNSSGEAKCIIKTTKVYVTEFINVSKEHIYKEGEGDRSLQYWWMVHKNFLINELASMNKVFTMT